MPRHYESFITPEEEMATWSEFYTRNRTVTPAGKKAWRRWARTEGHRWTKFSGGTWYHSGNTRRRDARWAANHK